MILWINGAFGVGKTQTAFELRYRLPSSVIFDPEEVGFFLARRLPSPGSVGDFQDLPLWRSWVSQFLAEAQSDPTELVIVPMTVVSAAYFQEIVGPLRGSGVQVVDYTLTATKATIESRIRRRGDAKAWNFQQVDRCLAGLSSEVFSNRIDTDALDLYGVVDHILDHSGLRPLSVRGNQHPLARLGRRLQVFLHHLRLA